MEMTVRSAGREFPIFRYRTGRSCGLRLESIPSVFSRDRIPHGQPARHLEPAKYCVRISTSYLVSTGGKKSGVGGKNAERMSGVGSVGSGGATGTWSRRFLPSTCGLCPHRQQGPGTCSTNSSITHLVVQISATTISRFIKTDLYRGHAKQSGQQSHSPRVAA